MAERFQNNVQTVLTADATAGATSLTVNSTSSFKSSGNYRILVDSEIMLVTAIPNATTFTVTRGVDGTTAVAHTAQSRVVAILTDTALTTFAQESIQSGTDASLPAVDRAGRLYLDTDGPYWYRDNGTTWDAWGPLTVLTKPDNTQFSWVNQGTATVSTTGGPIFLTAAAASGNNLKMRGKAPNATPWTATACIEPLAIGILNEAHFGLFWRDNSASSGTKIQTLSLQYSSSAGGWQIAGFNWTNETTFSANQWGANGIMTGKIWLRIGDDGTNRTYAFSCDGTNFLQTASIARDTFITNWSTTTRQIGFYASSSNSTFPASIRVISWKEA